MIVLEAVGKLVEVGGGLRKGQKGSKSTKCFTCQRSGAFQVAVPATPTVTPVVIVS